jgi:uncharacterized membrane protein
MNWLIKNFLRGLVILVPIAITVYLVVEAFVRIDRLLELRTPGLGFVVTVVLVVAVGALATNIVGRTLLRLTDTIFTRAPLVRIIYASVKDLLEAFVGEEKRFDKPVAVALTADGAVRSASSRRRSSTSWPCPATSPSTSPSPTAWPEG